MATIYDVSQSELVERTAEKLKNNDKIQPPAWASYVKTGVSKEKPPMRKDWWQVRAAAVLLKIYKKGPIGVAKLRTYYGAKKNRGVKPEHFFKGSGNIIRKVLQQLEAAGLAKQVDVSGHKGRIITKEGKLLLESIAVDVKTNPRPKAPKKVLEPKPFAAAPQQNAGAPQKSKRDASIPKQSKKGEE